MKPSTVSLILAMLTTAYELSTLITKTPPMYDTSMPLAMFLSAHCICRAIEEYRA